MFPKMCMDVLCIFTMKSVLFCMWLFLTFSMLISVVILTCRKFVSTVK